MNTRHKTTAGTKRRLLLFVLPLLLLSGCALDPGDKEFFYRSWARPGGQTMPPPQPPPEPEPPPQPQP